jgi:aspartate/methionine/tyrosine aminotransferase
MPSERPRLSRRVAAIAESATLAVDAKAKALKAAGESVIGFGAGEPDFPTPNHIVEAAVAACRDPRNHRYSPVAGLPELKAAIAAKTLRDSNYEVLPDQVIVTNGGKHAVYNTFTTLLNPGDEVLVPAPYWTTYPEPIALAGATPVVLPTDEATGFRVTVDQLDAARTAATKALLFVSPSNPTGAVYPEDEVRAIGEWAVEHGLWVVTDEIYEHLTYGDHRFTSMPAVVPELAEQCVVLNGVAKTYAMTGWRVGWMIGPADLTRAATNLQSHATSNVANVSQRAALAAVAGDLDAVAEMRDAYTRRGSTMHKLLNGIPGVTCMEPQGAFYAFPSFQGVLGKEIAGHRPETTLELADVILERAKVAIVPGEAFGAPGYARLSFALGDDDLGEGIERIADLLTGAS